jgi:CheY-like chemotaxis protein
MITKLLIPVCISLFLCYFLLRIWQGKFTIEHAINGLEAVEKCEARGEDEYGLIFMDVIMPVMDG